MPARLMTTLQTRIFLGCLAVVGVSLLFVALVTGRSLRGEMLASLQEALRGETVLLARLLEQHQGGGQDLDRLARDLGQRLEVRVDFISPQGRLLASSGPGSSQSETGDDLLLRPEVILALEKGQGRATGWDPVAKQEMFFVASRLEMSPSRQMVVRFGLPIDRLRKAQGEAMAMVVGAVLLGVALSLGMALLVARGISQPVRRLTRTAQAIAGGDLSQRFREYGHSEIGSLGRAFDQMADNLEARIGEITTGRDRLEAILGTMGEGVLVTDHEGVVTLANQALGRMLGVSGDPAGKHVSEVIRNSDLLAALRTVRKGRERLTMELRVVGPTPRYLEINLVRLAQEGGSGGVVTVLHDLTGRKQSETVLHDFVANVSHELRTPLTAIRGSAETLLSGAVDSPPDARRFTEMIARHVERMETLAEDLLDLAKLEARHEPLARDEVDGVELAGRALESVSELGRQGEVELRLAIPPQPVILAADANLLEQALINLLDNAIKYTDPGGRVTLELIRGEGELRFVVRDTGVGIAREHQQRIFERFYRVDKVRSRQKGGTGLGLAIVRQVAQAHQGRVEVQSTPGQGSAFSIILPMD